MAWLNNPPFALQDALQRGVDVYEVLYKDWGLGLGALADAWPPLDNPGIPETLAAIAIGPRSTVDRAWLTYNLGQAQVPQGIGSSAGTGVSPAVPLPVPPNLSIFTDRIRSFSVEAPLLFPQQAMQGAAARTGANAEFATMLLNNAMFIWPQGSAPQGIFAGFEIYKPWSATTGYSQYIDVNGVVRSLGPDVGGDVNDDGWVGPLLHLLLYLKPPLLAPPVRRAPLTAGAQVVKPIAIGQEACIAQIATFGRRNVHVLIEADKVCNFRVGAVRGMNVTLTKGVEEPVDHINSVAASTPTVMVVCNNQGSFPADWLTIYATPTLQTNPTVTWNVTAYD